LERALQQVEFYTEGAYMSGDIDFCRRTLRPVPLRQEVTRLAALPAFNIARELNGLKREVAREIGQAAQD